MLKFLLSVGALILAVLLVDLLVETDREQIERILEETRSAAIREDVDGCLRYFAPDAKTNGKTLESARKTLETVFARYTAQSIALSVRKMKLESQTAEVGILCLVRMIPTFGRDGSSPLAPGQSEQPARVDFDVGFRKRQNDPSTSSGRWEIVSVQYPNVLD